MRRSAPSSSHGTSYTLPKGSPALTFLARFPNDQRNAALDCVALYGLHALLSTYSLNELTASLGALEAITETACRGAGKLLHKVHVPRAGQGGSGGGSTNVVFGAKPPKRLARQAAATAAAAARAATLATSAAAVPTTTSSSAPQQQHAAQASGSSSNRGRSGGVPTPGSRGVSGGGAPDSGTIQSRYAENAERAAAAAAAAALAATNAAAQAAGNVTQSRHDVCSAWPFVDEEGTVTDALQGGGGASEWLPNPSTKRPPGGGAANSGGFGGQRSGGHAPGRAPPPNAATLSSSQRRATAAENAAHSGGSGLWNWAGGDGNKGGGGGEGLRGSVFESAPLREQLRRVAKVFDEYCNHKQRVSRFELVDMLGDLGLSACFDELVLVLPPPLVPLPRGPFGLDTDHATHAAIAWLTEHQFRRVVNELLVARNCPELPLPGDDLTRPFTPLVAGGDAPFARASSSHQARAERAAYEAVLGGKDTDEFEEKNDDYFDGIDDNNNGSDSYFDEDVPLSSILHIQKQLPHQQQQRSNMIPPRGRAARDAAAASATRSAARQAVDSYATTASAQEGGDNNIAYEDEEEEEGGQDEMAHDHRDFNKSNATATTTGGKMFETWVPLSDDDDDDNDRNAGMDVGYGGTNCGSRPPRVGGSGQGGKGTRVATGKASGRGALKPNAGSGSALVGGSGTYGVEPWSTGFLKKGHHQDNVHHNNNNNSSGRSSSSSNQGRKGTGRPSQPPPWREDIPEGQPGAEPWQQQQGGFGLGGFGTRFSGGSSGGSTGRHPRRQQRALPAYLQGVGSKLKDAIGRDKELHERNRAAGQDALVHTLVEQHAQHPDKGYLRGGPHTKTAPLASSSYSSSSSRASGKARQKQGPPAASSSGNVMLQEDAHWEAIADAMLSSDLLNNAGGGGGSGAGLDAGPPVEVYMPPPPPPLPKPSSSSSSSALPPTAVSRSSRHHGSSGSSGAAATGGRSRRLWNQEASRPRRDYSGWVGDFGNVRDFDFDSQPAFNEEENNLPTTCADFRGDSYSDANYGDLSSEARGGNDSDYGNGGADNGCAHDDDKRWKLSSNHNLTTDEDLAAEEEGDSASGLFPRRSDDLVHNNEHAQASATAAATTAATATLAEDEPASHRLSVAAEAGAAAAAGDSSAADSSSNSRSGAAPPGGGTSDGSLVAPWVSPLPPTAAPGVASSLAGERAEDTAAPLANVNLTTMSPSSFDGSTSAAAAAGDN